MITEIKDEDGIVAIVIDEIVYHKMMADPIAFGSHEEAIVRAQAMCGPARNFPATPVKPERAAAMRRAMKRALEGFYYNPG